MQTKTNRLLYLSYADVTRVEITMAEIIESMERMFRAKGEGKTEMPPKPGIHPGGDNFIHAMPAYIPDLASAGIKWVSGFPKNPAKGLPYISGLLIFNDVHTGLPLSVMDCVWITAKRTGAASAISARYLARPESTVMGMLGCGVQGRSHVEAMNVLFPLKKVMAYDINPDVQSLFAGEIRKNFDLEVVPVKTPREAVSGCDIVVTAGPMMKKPHGTIQAGWLDEGTFASLPELHADLGELASGQKPGRQTPEERTMTANLGLALNDMAVAPLVYQKAMKKGIGTWLDL